jgi:hypothetical protein
MYMRKIGRNRGHVLEAVRVDLLGNQWLAAIALFHDLETLQVLVEPLLGVEPLWPSTSACSFSSVSARDLDALTVDTR